jgi:transcriptional regulator with XRE-family HTH domain
MQNTQEVKNHFSKQFYKALKHKNLEKYTYKELGKLLDVSDVIVYKWLNNKAIPSIARIPIIANKLGVSVEYLLNIDEATNTSDENAQMLGSFNKLNTEQKQAVLNLLRSFDV